MAFEHPIFLGCKAGSFQQSFLGVFRSFWSRNLKISESCWEDFRRQRLRSQPRVWSTWQNWSRGSRAPLNRKWLPNRTLFFQINFGNSCSVITELNCFWNYLVSARSVSRGLPNRLPNCFWNYLVSARSVSRGLLNRLPNCFGILYSVIWVEELPNWICFGISSVIFLCVMVFHVIRPSAVSYLVWEQLCNMMGVAIWMRIGQLHVWQAQSTRTAKFDPTSGSTSVPTSGPTKAPTRAPTKVRTRVPATVHFPVSALRGLLTKVPTKDPTRVSTEVPTKVSTTAVDLHMSCFHMFCSLPNTVGKV